MSNNASSHKKNTDPVNIFTVICYIAVIVTMLLIMAVVAAVAFAGINSWSGNIPDALLFSLVNTVKSAAVSSVFCILISLPAAYCLSRMKLPWFRLWDFLLELGSSLPGLVLGFGLLVLGTSNLIGIKESGYVATWQDITIVLFAVNLPSAIALVRQTFNSINPKLEFMAENLGATPYYLLSSILLPLTKYKLCGIALRVFAQAMMEFGAILIFTGFTPFSTEILTGSLWLGISQDNPEYAALSASLLVLLAAIVLLLARWIEGQRPIYLRQH